MMCTFNDDGVLSITLRSDHTRLTLLKNLLLVLTTFLTIITPFFNFTVIHRSSKYKNTYKTEMPGLQKGGGRASYP